MRKKKGKRKKTVLIFELKMEDSYVGKSIRVRCGGSWMEGFIDEYHPDRGYHVQYFDGDDAWIPSVNDPNVQVEMAEGDQNTAEQRDNGDFDDIDFFDRQEELDNVDIPGLSEPEDGNMNEDEDEDEDEEELHIIPSNAMPKKSTSRSSSSHHSLADPDLQDLLDMNIEEEEDGGVPLDDDILMGEDLDEDIMLKTADEYVDVYPITQNEDQHVVVHTYEGNEELEEQDHPSLASARKVSSSRSEEKMITPRQETEEEEEEDHEESPEDELPIYHNPEYFQEKIHEIISSQSIYLQNNNILLVGSVLSASFYDVTSNDKDVKKSAKETSYDYKQLDERRERDSSSSSSSASLKKNTSKSNNELLKKQEMFFRVLFIEGGNQPIMFRCKTPIFTSHHTIVKKQIGENAFLPKWKENIFRCDLIMPVVPANTSLSNKKSSTGSLLGRGKQQQQQQSSQGRLLATVAESKNERERDNVI
jgi:hypothetical protein